MNKFVNEWLVDLHEIGELQDCLIDVVENSMDKEKKAYYSISLIQCIRNRIDALYDSIDSYPSDK